LSAAAADAEVTVDALEDARVACHGLHDRDAATTLHAVNVSIWIR